MLASKAPAAAASPSGMLSVAKKSLNGTGSNFMLLDGDVKAFSEMREEGIVVDGLRGVDGEYVILVKNSGKL